MAVAKPFCFFTYCKSQKMNFENALQQIGSFGNLQVLANQVVEGFISGIHKSPFRGFSSEFAEHKSFNTGDSTRHIDWKHYAKTDRLFIKTYEEETNLRCHLIVDNSASMHYPKVEKNSNQINKIRFAALAAATLANLLKRQRDAVGLSVYSDTYEFYAPEKGSDRHHRMITAQLENLLSATPGNATETTRFLHQIAEKLKRRSLVFLFTDMFEAGSDTEVLFGALKHLRYNKHRVVLFHIIDNETEMALSFDNRPRRFVDVETGQQVDLYAESVQAEYQKEVAAYFKSLRLQCAKYKITYLPIDIKESLHQVMLSFLSARGKF